MTLTRSRPRSLILLIPAFAIALTAGGACSKREPAAPPDARRPALRSEQELADERQQRVADGRVAPESQPAFVSAEQSRIPRVESAAAPPRPGEVAADVLLVDDEVLTTAEVLYALRDRIEEARRAQTRGGFLEQLTRMIRRETQERVGRALLYRKAIAPLSEPARENITRAVNREFDEELARDFSGSRARMEIHLRRYGLSIDQYRAGIERRLVVQQYLFETMRPTMHLRRDEILEEYRRQLPRFTTSELRELFIIEAPFERFLTGGGSWAQASPQQQAAARVRAVQHIRAAHEALASEPFEDVARRMSRGLHADEGGAWGAIGRPLTGAYEPLSALIFQFEPGQVSEPIESPTGWYIVRCGAVRAGRIVPFEEAQAALRQEMADERFNVAATDYVLKLAARATLTSSEAFIREAIRRASAPGWPDAPTP
ncbi:MAG: peptidyl-prolyl cis-trans isomerase [Phycisphaerales bacterium]|nr:peptidyl-prolyl cis-trans isomerase [Phycisphaerales bacterium]